MDVFRHGIGMPSINAAVPNGNSERIVGKLDTIGIRSG
jgi:hypothetical protein